MFTYKDFTEKQKEDIKNMYLEGKSTVVIGKKYNVTNKVISKVLDLYNIKRVGNGRRKYNLNEEYFDNIDNPNKAYILGLLYADGSNNLKKQTISLSLEENDFRLLENIRNEIKSEKPLEFLDYSQKHDFGYSYKNQYRLLIFSKHMCSELSNKGMVQNKSLILSFPNWLKGDLYSHFIRGYYDGDGSVYRQVKNKYNHAITVTITSTESFCLSVKNICENILNVSPKIYDASCHNGITKVLTFSGRNISKIFLDWIYKDADIFLERKYNRYIDYYYINTPLSA